MILEYFDLEMIADDLKELFEKCEERSNELKREYEGERSIQYSLLEEYFYNIKKSLEDNRKLLCTNINNVTNIDLKDTNIFYKILSR